MSDDTVIAESAFERERLVRLVQPYIPEEHRLPRWLVLGVLAVTIVGLLGAAFLSGTELLARYAAKSVAPIDQPPAQAEPEGPAALARPLPRSSPAPSARPARTADR